MNSRVVSKWLMKTVGLFCAVASLITFPLCRAAFAQNKTEVPNAPITDPLYLSDIQTLSGQEIKTGKATILGKEYFHSISLGGYNGKPIDIVYSLPKGYTRFRTSVGIDQSFLYDHFDFEYIVRGRDANGVERNLGASKYVTPSGKPQEINVDITGMTQLTLRLKINLSLNGGVLVNSGNPWWCEARLTNEGPAANGTYTLVFDEATKKQKLLELAQALMKDLNIKELAVGLFLLNSLPDKPLDLKTATDIQAELRDDLLRTKPMLELAAMKDNFSEAIKGFRPGDDLDAEPAKAVDKGVDQHYILLGTIKDNGDSVMIRAAVYNTHTGKVVAESEAHSSIPIVAHNLVAAPFNGVIDPTPEHTVSTKFRPDKKLRVTSFQWLVDGKAQGKNKCDGMNIADVPVPLDKKEHKFELVWSGDGFDTKDNRGQPTVHYDNITVEFELQAKEGMSIEVSAKVDTVPLLNQHSLNVVVKADGRPIKSKH